VRVDDHGSICLVRPISNRAHSWLDDNVSADAMWFGGALVVEPRYVSDLVVGMAAAGFCISGGRAVR
jgi:hypothetical protein